MKTLPRSEAEELLIELRSAYPSLYMESMEELAGQPEAFGPVDKLLGLIRIVRDAAKNPPPMHDGDWEGICVYLAEDGATPQYAELFQ